MVEKVSDSCEKERRAREEDGPLNMKRYPSSRSDFEMRAETDEEPAPEAFTEEDRVVEVSALRCRKRRRRVELESVLTDSRLDHISWRANSGSDGSLKLRQGTSKSVPRSDDDRRAKERRTNGSDGRGDVSLDVVLEVARLEKLGLDEIVPKKSRKERCVSDKEVGEGKAPRGETHDPS